MKFTLLSFVIALFIFSSLPSLAQVRLPRIQVSTVKVDSKVVIDGNINDWPKGFQAYNTRTNIYYSFAHDNNNIYLLVRAESYEAIKKILLGGVSLSLQGESVNDPDNEVRIRYPAYDKFHPSWTINREASKDQL